MFSTAFIFAFLDKIGKIIFVFIKFFKIENEDLELKR